MFQTLIYAVSYSYTIAIGGGTQETVKLLVVGGRTYGAIAVIVLAAHLIHVSESTFSTDAHGENHAVLQIFAADARMCSSPNC
jgi:hypothetical protein